MKRSSSFVPVLLLCAAWYGAVTFVPAAVSRRAVLGAVILGNSKMAEADEPEDIPWVGKYTEEGFDGCQREIGFAGFAIRKGFEPGSISAFGTKGKPGPGCSEESGQAREIKRWSINKLSVIEDPKSPTLVMDLLQIGGKAKTVATWDGEGIRFDDGRYWKKVKNVNPALSSAVR
mmetsp:Transcript_106838/g.189883  ORF Transcript_106838/g.189883 Transcript_106838/m.189883 type:complete len:175 (-) Transcript_106838:126-650(-)|eukprot:CAMPEP_0197653410 /NCGR_PEP_ID=MMETSP1338-20131121/35401_1 /TAXON_ID=43686 ORGANISM="Pelagodinium beii, Strain RCC1491" /NCGR_SAMPLE_ID=MMETSP1338 /ASSEMBLY_ACC=CAM_ASM_000754 /LENGTH=174 /DNA_ID=CAMNT_0043228513 /DNA_START=49 /DNA_END=573 /DNA_ORIENTATION=-